MITNNPYVVAAICGNFWQESTVNPGIWEGLVIGNPGFGLGQWTDNPPIVMRRTALFDYLDAHGYSRDSGDGQLEFLIYEDLWIPSLIQQSAYNTLTDYFNSSSTSLSDLVLEWMYHWEGINDGSDANRLSFAQTVLPYIQNPPTGRDPWHTSNSYNSQANAIENSLLIRDYLMGTGPTPPGPGPQPADEELLAIIAKARRNKQKGGIFILW